VGVVDFKKNKFEYLEFNKAEENSDPLYFDLASMTKMLSLSFYYCVYRKQFSSEMKLLLNHRAGLPAWGRLSPRDWKKQIEGYAIHESPSLYSDFSALRLMLEIEKKTGQGLYQLVAPFWHPDVKFWKDLPAYACSPITGIRNGKEIKGQVHDDNAFAINQFCSHAGLFSTIGGLCETLLNFNQQNDLIGFYLKEQSYNHDRFVAGMDTVSGPSTLAGSMAGPKTFGHLGFTGTSVWIDPQQLKGQIILTNYTELAWFDRAMLSNFRKEVGNILWDLKL